MAVICSVVSAGNCDAVSAPICVLDMATMLSVVSADNKLPVMLLSCVVDKAAICVDSKLSYCPVVKLLSCGVVKTEIEAGRIAGTKVLGMKLNWSVLKALICDVFMPQMSAVSNA